MGFYTEVLFPWGMDLTMSGDAFSQLRKQVLSEAKGEVLEIGFGTGLNLPHYPPTVQHITTVDPNPGMNRYAKQQIAKSSIDVDRNVLSSEALPMADNRFDTVVSTWTLCSIKQIEKALSEVKRVLKHGGQFIFLEHGLSDEPNVQKWQHRLNPIQNVVGDGCHVNRDMRALIEACGFSSLNIENFYMNKAPKFIGYLYKGVAIK